MDDAGAWQLCSAGALAWRRWDDEIVLYNDVTGSTHELGMLGAEVMLALIDHPAGIGMADLVANVTAHVELPVDMSCSAEVSRVLDQLVELQLATHVPA